MKLQAHAKLNLFLEITGKRADGYHELQSLAVFLDIADEISARPASEISLTGSDIEDNIILRAAHAIKTRYGINAGIEFTLTKNIPLGAGLGGGSADAAAALILTRKIWELDIPDTELYEIALTLGADVPACLYSQLNHKNSVYFAGIGEILTPAEIEEELLFVLINPKKELATKSVFEQFILGERTPKTSRNFYERENHLESAAIEIMPEITTIIEDLRNFAGCKLARMTGSGATCFGIFPDKTTQQQALQQLRAKYPAYWVEPAQLRN
ncbi:MAG: 4-(cytidine 5'-diphospho)-2-C-methyl-D-erythritol kinase [Alphaproteobacteria bacterium CG11_big_fil_rev_8_21_14_0_20_44_7]|nr:MAG: 4-(cytidine 5'-diphospho)-2-C-methyl-D-erythritol kinase [Alphaproteobacteria bacterium CG11_big_fil_rev_8_21_14_0_20_44_7]